MYGPLSLPTDGPPYHPEDPTASIWERLAESSALGLTLDAPDSVEKAFRLLDELERRLSASVQRVDSREF
jgi:hypothetical protein